MEQQIYFEALNDPIRRRILALLLDAEERCVCEMHGLLDASQPKVSRHLGVLREAGLVLARRDGVWMHYRIHPGLPAWAYRILLHMKDGMPLLPVTESVAKSQTCAPACANPTN